jgi:hypothetical protein
MRLLDRGTATYPIQLHVMQLMYKARNIQEKFADTKNILNYPEHSETPIHPIYRSKLLHGLLHKPY